MHPERYALTFACYNQLAYTRHCIESLVQCGLDLGRLVVVDNASHDGTWDYLESLPLGGRIRNRNNLGCGVAWNQGALALQAEWTVVMNNDLLVTPGWLAGLIGCAEAQRLRILSPAMVEGALDYDLNAFASEAAQKMGQVVRLGGKHAVCMAIHQSVWQEIGYFQANPRLLGYEDTLFFHAAEQAAIPSAITGAAWIHHFGSITQSAMKRERGIAEQQVLNDRRYNKAQLGSSWIGRKIARLRQRRRARSWREQELKRCAMTLHGERREGAFYWR